MKFRIRSVGALAWLGSIAVTVSGACYQLIPYGSGCSLAKALGPDECVLSTTTNLPQVNGNTNSGTGQGENHVTCTFQVLCDRQIGRRDETGDCYAHVEPNGVDDVTKGTSCVLDGALCTMTIGGDT